MEIVYVVLSLIALYIAYRYGKKDGEFNANDTEYWKGYRDALNDMEKIGVISGIGVGRLRNLIEQHIDGGNCDCPLHKRRRWVYADQPEQDPDLG